MNEINLKDYEFDEQLLKNVELFDEVLKELGEPPILENKIFLSYIEYKLLRFGY